MPFAAGGAVDASRALLGNKLSEQLGQPVVVENRAGAGGNLAPDALAKAAPDGYTILLTTNGLAISPSLYRTLPFDVHKDFVPVTQVVASQLVIAAYPKLAANSIAELIALAKAKPGQPQLRLDRHRQSAASDHGDAEDIGRHRARRRCPTAATRRSMPR